MRGPAGPRASPGTARATARAGTGIAGTARGTRRGHPRGTTAPPTPPPPRRGPSACGGSSRRSAARSRRSRRTRPARGAVTPKFLSSMSPGKMFAPARSLIALPYSRTRVRAAAPGRARSAGTGPAASCAARCRGGLMTSWSPSSSITLGAHERFELGEQRGVEARARERDVASTRACRPCARRGRAASPAGTSP